MESHLGKDYHFIGNKGIQVENEGYHLMKNELLANSLIFENFILKGFHVFPEIDFIPFEFFHHLDFLNAEDYQGGPIELDFYGVNVQRILAKAQTEMKESFLSQFFPEVVSLGCFLWDGADKNSQEWHNDFKSMEYHNCNFLFYLDDMSSKIGGSLSVKGPLGIEKIYPQRKMLIWLNQKHCFFHRAEKAKRRRRVIEFRFHIKNL